MRKVKMGLMAFAALFGVGSALAFNHPKKVFGATYYGYRIDATHMGWALTPPAMTTCQPDDVFACTITSTAQQSTVLSTVNAYPPNTGTKNNQDKLWE